jgi:LmbE family N-acetylglucosaminyl deacetylase
VRTYDVADLGTILSVWAHPDDETYLAGGVMAAAADNGQRVVCVSASAGEHGTDDPERWPPQRLARVRRLEASAAMAVLRVAEHHVLGFPDGELAVYAELGVDAVGALLDDVAPDTILTFGPDGMTMHPDHIAVHRWVGEAWRRRGCRARLLHSVWTVAQLELHGDRHAATGVFMADERPHGVPDEGLALHLRLRGDDLDRKIVALRAMATQTAATVTAVGLETYATTVDEECFVEAARVEAPQARSTTTSR